MIDQAKLKISDKICYQPKHYLDTVWENGMVKEIPNHTTKAVRVVYNCGGDWKNFKNYTSALTNLRDLVIGWKHRWTGHLKMEIPPMRNNMKNIPSQQIIQILWLI